MEDLYIRMIVKVILKDEYEQTFDLDTTDIEIGEKEIKFFLDAMLKYDIPPERFQDPKNSTQSRIHRLRANKLFTYVKPPFTEDECIHVLKRYNKSIAYAPCQSEELALNYAARSAILMKLKKYNLCIEDIDRALVLPCPDLIRAKICVRKVDCLNALGDSKAKDLIQETRLLLEELDLTDTLKRKLIEKLDSTKMAEDVRKPDDPEQLPLPRINNPNTEAPCASDAVAIAYNEEYGRHLVATRDIMQGELLIVEKPYSMTLALNKLYTNCSNCFEMSWTSIPCNYCATAIYCSKDCRNKNWRRCHDIECTVFASLYEKRSKYVEITICSLRLAILAIKEFASIEKLRNEVNEVDNCKDPRTKGFSNDGVLTGDKYRNVLGIEIDTDTLSKEEQLILALHTSYILCYLSTGTNLFGNPIEIQFKNSLTSNNDIMFIGTLLFRHLQLLRLNGQSIYEESESGEWIKCGFGILPFSSIMYHGWRANTIIQRKSERGPLRYATRRIARNIIKEGEQLYDCCYLHDADSLTVM